MILYPADRVVEVAGSKKLGVTAAVSNVDFRAVMDRMRAKVRAGRERVKKGIEQSEELAYYAGEARFVGDHILEVAGKKIRGKKIFIASGARPLVPKINGIEAIDYLTNDTVLALDECPGSIIILGGGYIAAEYAHFFSAMGSKVTVIQRNKRLVPEEEPEVSELLRKALSRRMAVHTDTEAVRVKKSGAGVTVTARDRGSGKEHDVSAEKLLVAAGRQSNADLLNVAATGVTTDERGFIKVNDFFETSAKDIWAFGDALGRKMFKHVANREAGVVWHNAAHDKKGTVDYLSAPHAVFTYPEIASVGLTEAQARKAASVADLLVGTAKYDQVARGEAMMEDEGFAKAIVRKKSGRILGFHIIGPHASILLQEVVNVMANGQDMWAIARAMHIHPALSELVLTALGNLEEIE